MNDKLPTINIKGKEYVMVKDRILAFNEQYKNGMITTSLLPSDIDGMFILEARVTPDIEKANRYFVAHSQAIMGKEGVNATSALENAETSAIGRALSLLGIGVIESIASADEVNKASYQPTKLTKKTATTKSSHPYPAEHLKDCDKCDSPITERNGKYGPFYSCLNYPKCKRTLKVEDAQKWLRSEYVVAEAMGGSVEEDVPPPEEYPN